MKDIFMVSDSKRLQMYFGYPTFMTCAKPIMRYQTPPMTPELEHQLQGTCDCNYYPRCRYNYLSPFE